MITVTHASENCYGLACRIKLGFTESRAYFGCVTESTSKTDASIWVRTERGLYLGASAPKLIAALDACKIQGLP